MNFSAAIAMPAEDLLIPLARDLCRDRDEAVRARASTGVESIWQRARDQYAGIDEVNRGRSGNSLSNKSLTMDGPIRVASPLGLSDRETRSTVFVNITRPYANAGTARVADILLPTGKMPWDLTASPVSDLQLLAEALTNYPNDAAMLFQAMPELQQQITSGKAEVDAAIETAKQVIKDWLEECDWLGQVRTQIIEAGLVGTGVMKGPFPKPRTVSPQIQQALNMLALQSPTGQLVAKQLENRLLYAPVLENIKVENCYPAPGCGRDVQNGKFFFERIPDVSRRRLEEFLEDPTYFADQIRACLKEGPKSLQDNKGVDKDKGYDLWIRTGMVDLSDYVSQLETLEDAAGDIELSEMFLTVTLCNHRIIKIAEPMLNCKEFPYRMLLWEPRDDSWAGIGIPEQIETPQRGLNAAVRALMDNMGYSVGPQVLEVEDLIEPKEGDDYQMRPYKHWVAKTGIPGSGALDDPSKAMTFLQFPNYLNEIMPVIQYWLKMAEDTTGLPLLLQGQASTDAVGVSQQLMNNASTNLRLIVKAWDDCVCKPNIEDLYEWCQLYGPETARGDAKAIPLGSSTLLVKELQMQAMLQVLDRAVQPIYGLSPKRIMTGFLEGFQIDAENYRPDEQEMQQLQAAANKPDPRVESAQIQAQAQTVIAQIRDATDRLKIAIDAQAKALQVQQASDAVDTQASANIAQETLKQQGEHERKGAEIAAVPPTTKPNGEAKPEEPPMDVDKALNTLGLQ